jgi:uncharacterized protein (DUF1684 family)
MVPFTRLAIVARAAGAATLLAATACTSGPGKPVDTRPYDQQVSGWRQSKDVVFKSAGPGSESPIPLAQRAAFPGLVYFDVDPNYRVPASLTLQPGSDPLVIVLKTTGPEKERRMQKVGTLAFSLQGTPHKLIAFADEGSLRRLFVPFADLTNGPDTYRGGRYMEIERTPTGIYDLDFNYAFNPYCVYNTSYDCPLPPRENRLPAPIRAGEKLPAGHE